MGEEELFSIRREEGCYPSSRDKTIKAFNIWGRPNLGPWPWGWKGRAAFEKHCPREVESTLRNARG